MGGMGQDFLGQVLLAPFFCLIDRSGIKAFKISPRHIKAPYPITSTALPTNSRNNPGPS